MLSNPPNLNQMLTMTAEAMFSNLQTEWFKSLMQKILKTDEQNS